MRAIKDKLAHMVLCAFCHRGHMTLRVALRQQQLFWDIMGMHHFGTTQAMSHFGNNQLVHFGNKVI